MNIKTLILIGALTLPIISCDKTENITGPGEEQNDNNNSGNEDEDGDGNQSEDEKLEDDTPASDGNVDSNITGATVNYETNNAISGWFTDTWATSIVTENNDIYAVYVDSELKPHVCKITGETIASDKLIEEGFICSNNGEIVDGHDEFCISLDKKGYIHIMGNMHNGFLRYWRSNSPYDIEAGFTPHHKEIDGTFSYYYFRKSNSGELFMSARSGTKIEWWYEGGRGIGLYKYNCDTQRWEARGGNAPDGGIFKVIYYEKLPKYHMYKSDFRFDKNDRLHFTVLSQVGNGTTVTSNVIYAYSDDYGVTWNNSKGKISSLPMRLSTVDIIEQHPDVDGKSLIGEGVSILLNKDNIPGLLYSVDNKTKYSYLKNGKWYKRVLVDGVSLYRTETLSSDNGMYIIESFGSDKVWKLPEYGQPAECYAIGYRKTRWDHEGWKKGIFRFTHWDNNVWKVVTIPSF